MCLSNDVEFGRLPCKGGGGLYTVAQLVETLCYELEGCGFNCQWGHWDFSLTYSFHPHCGSVVDSSPNRNEYQEYLLG